MIDDHARAAARHWAEMFSAAARYFALVFGVAFLFGMIRVPLIVPRIGERYAELAELPNRFATTSLPEIQYLGTRIWLPCSSLH
ncbi:MAG: hypothetical protein ABI640_16775 [Gammaproteobacteria bacterium]